MASGYPEGLKRRGEFCRDMGTIRGTYTHDGIHMPKFVKIKAPEGDHITCGRQTVLFGGRVGVGKNTVEFDCRSVSECVRE